MRRFRLRTSWIPSIVLLASLLLTLAAGLAVERMDRAADQLRFENQVQQTQDAIAARIQTYISSLLGVSGLFAAGPVDRDGFRAYVERLDVSGRYPGIQGIGFSRRVAPADVPALVAEMRAQGLPDFHIWPMSERPEYHTIVYLEPSDQRNLAAIGYDMFSEPVRRAAMEQARDTGAPAASGRVTLVQEIDQNKQAGFLIYVPVYRGGKVPDTVEERRASLLGFAYSPFRAGDLLQGILGSQSPARIAFQLYDGAEHDSAHLLYSSEPPGAGPPSPAFSTTTSLVVAGREWSLTYSSLPGFQSSNTRYLPLFIVLAGLLVSLALFGVTRAQAVARGQAEEAVRIRDVFLSVASHELKTPLTALLGNAQLLQRRWAAGKMQPERDRRVVHAIAEQAQRLNRLIAALLDHSRLQAGRLAIARRPLDLVALVRRVVDEVSPTLLDHAIDLRAPDEPLAIVGDELRLDQVLQNLLGNAIKYSPRGGPIAVAVEREGAWGVVRVTDRGMGIPAESLPHLFQQFYRATNAANQSISGLGIGLYITHEIIAQHGGEIAVESVEGEGSTFTVRLPLAAPSTTSPAPVPEPDRVTR